MLELGWGLTPYFTLVLYIASIIIILATIVWRIEPGIFFLTLFLPIQNVLDSINIYPGGQDVNDFVIIAILIRWMLDRKKKGGWKKSPLNVPVLLWIAWSYMGIWIGSAYLELPSPVSIGHPLFVSWKNYCIPIFLYFAIVNNIDDRRTLQWLVITMAFTLLVLDRNFYNVMALRDTSHYSDELKDSFLNTGVALNGNSLAVFLAQFAILFVALIPFEQVVWRKILYIVISGLSYYCVMFLFSRSGYLAAIAGWIGIGMVNNRKIVIGLVLLVLFWKSFLPNAVVERVEMTTSEDGFDGTSRQRIGMWKQAEEMISQSPIWGAGFGVTPLLTISAGSEWDRVWGSFHNNYVQTAVESGIVGIGLVMVIYLMIFGLAFQLNFVTEDPYTKGIAAGMAACVMAMLAGNIAGSYWHFFTLGSHFWILAGIMIKFRELSIQKKADPSIAADLPGEESLEAEPALPAHEVKLVETTKAELK
jgi:O-antigen ligase